MTLQFGACYIRGQWDKFRIKNATLCLLKMLQYLFDIFFGFSPEICVFILFILLLMKYKISATLINRNRNR